MCIAAHSRCLAGLDDAALAVVDSATSYAIGLPSKGICTGTHLHDHAAPDGNLKISATRELTAAC